MSRNVQFGMDGFIAVTKALSDTNRVRALMALRKGELCVCQIIELLGLAPSTVSKHMSVLKQAGLVDSRKDSRWVYYRLADETTAGRDRYTMIDLLFSLLEQDKQIRGDDTKMSKITAEGLEALCKRQRCSNGN